MPIGEAMLRRHGQARLWPWLVLGGLALLLVTLAILTHLGVVPKPRL
jgi:hypothetical protein